MKSCIVFAYHNIGICGLKMLLKHKFKIQLVVTHKDQKKENLWFDSVSKFCERKKLNYKIFEEINFKKIATISKELKPDYLFSFYFRKILKKNILDSSKICSINLHGSYLPNYRGSAPVNWQIINGEKRGGVSLHLMNEKIDSGNIISQKKIIISKTDNPISLFYKIEKKSEKLLDEQLPKLLNGIVKTKPQRSGKFKIYKKRNPEDGKINWNNKTETIYNFVRGITYPYPGAYTYFNNKKIIIWEAKIEKNNIRKNKFKIGKFFKDKKYYKVNTLDGILILKNFQMEKLSGNLDGIFI